MTLYSPQVWPNQTPSPREPSATQAGRESRARGGESSALSSRLREVSAHPSSPRVDASTHRAGAAPPASTASEEQLTSPTHISLVTSDVTVWIFSKPLWTVRIGLTGGTYEIRSSAPPRLGMSAYCKIRRPGRSVDSVDYHLTMSTVPIRQTKYFLS